MDALPDPLIAAAIGLLGGVLLGLAGQLGRFCTLGAIEDGLYGRDFLRLRMWSLAIGLSIIGAFALVEVGLLRIGATVYAAQAFDPVAAILGGLVFGYGMAMAGNCGLGALTRFGGGDIRSLVIVIVMGIVAYMTIGGPLGMLRIWAFPDRPASGALSDYGYAHWLEALTGLPALAVALLIGAAFAAVALADRSFRASPPALVWSAAVAGAILSGWTGLYGLSVVSFDEIPVQSHTFTAPVGETLLYLMTASGGGIGFPIGSVFGVILGSAAASLAKKRFRWEACDDPRELGRQIFGAALMGVGAVTALGCSVGQGLTAFSTLAFSAPLVLAAIVAGAGLGLRRLIHG